MFLTHKEFDYMKSQVFYKGVIEDNDDPKGYGRVRVRILGVHNDTPSEVPTNTLPWATIARSLDFGGLKDGIGISSIPQVGTWVYLFFDMNEPDRPVVIGAIAGKDSGLNSLIDYAGKHTIKTPANHQIILNDAELTISIIHPSGTSFVINQDGSITVDGKNKIDVLSATDVNITATGNAKIEASQITLKSSANTMVI